MKFILTVAILITLMIPTVTLAKVPYTPEEINLKLQKMVKYAHCINNYGQHKKAYKTIKAHFNTIWLNLYYAKGVTDYDRAKLTKSLIKKRSIYKKKGLMPNKAQCNKWEKTL